jgi:hypothetical protein
VIIVGLAVFEGFFIQKQFNELHQSIDLLYDKIEEESATQNDVLAVQSCWIKKKKSLHVFIPHNEIKELELWIAETVTLVKDKEWSDAVSKVEVLIELTEQIPKTFKLSFDNIL